MPQGYIIGRRGRRASFLPLPFAAAAAVTAVHVAILVASAPAVPAAFSRSRAISTPLPPKRVTARQYTVAKQSFAQVRSRVAAFVVPPGLYGSGNMGNPQGGGQFGGVQLPPVVARSRAALASGVGIVLRIPAHVSASPPTSRILVGPSVANARYTPRTGQAVLTRLPARSAVAPSTKLIRIPAIGVGAKPSAGRAVLLSLPPGLYGSGSMGDPQGGGTFGGVLQGLLVGRPVEAPKRSSGAFLRLPAKTAAAPTVTRLPRIVTVVKGRVIQPPSSQALLRLTGRPVPTTKLNLSVFVARPKLVQTPGKSIVVRMQFATVAPTPFGPVLVPVTVQSSGDVVSSRGSADTITVASKIDPVSVSGDVA